MSQEKSNSFIKQNSQDIYPYTTSNRKNKKTDYKKLYEKTIFQIDKLEKKAQHMLKQMQEITKDLKRLERKNEKHKNLLNQASHHFAFTWDLFLDHQKENKNNKEEKIEEITNNVDEFEKFINYQYEKIYNQPATTEINQQEIIEKEENFNSNYTNYLLDNQCNNYIYYTTNYLNKNTFYNPNIEF
ncbi:hypothetical protein C2G38_2049322 [Gigaspora rosea]|uniref:Uncharacterized protein n=1 Tax=Gigaspora rosea TaxID=44941 RepID=A0A397U129_9GLOM|nr:hypothetical protein C2G38_2049322 [Gigaspora rosea]